MTMLCRNCNKEIHQTVVESLSFPTGQWVHSNTRRKECSLAAPLIYGCKFCQTTTTNATERCDRCTSLYNLLATMPNSIISNIVQAALDNREMKLTLKWPLRGNEPFRHGRITHDFQADTMSFEFGKELP